MVCDALRVDLLPGDALLTKVDSLGDGVLGRSARSGRQVASEIEDGLGLEFLRVLLDRGRKVAAQPARDLPHSLGQTGTCGRFFLASAQH